MPEAERRLWARLTNHQLGGFRFRRQHAIGPYVADFVSIEARLVIECDGEQHGADDALAHDAKRTAFMESEGWMVLRFWNPEIYDNMDGVLETILDAARNSVVKDGEPKATNPTSRLNNRTLTDDDNDVAPPPSTINNFRL